MKVAPAMTTMAAASHWAKRAIWRNRGVVRGWTWRSMPLMRPISVLSPVAITTPWPCP